MSLAILFNKLALKQPAIASVKVMVIAAPAGRSPLPAESCVSAPSCAQKFDREAFCDRAVVDDISQRILLRLYHRLRQHHYRPVYPRSQGMSLEL
jgi:hypothetical protein